MADNRKKIDTWLDVYVATGDARQAVIEAGYDCSDANISRIAYANKVACADRIIERTRQQLSQAAPMAIGVLANLATSAESEAVRRQAAKDIAAMAGLDIQRTEDVTKHDTRSDAELQAELVALLKSSDMPDELLQAFRVATNPGDGAAVISIDKRKAN